ncbi:YdeI/OmpD-associated family protein [Paenibacillus oenotherae]|uniref:YdeI/OmpD-associated family protein n=1 Tax=Paenibacillus oenotherae TaxID=1435645 RepID=A0ABS7D8B4_9BACL|nr:YdeI/OmpD-associated family protein [Paenibacillus oenotherae]MBW7476177.1 YdeI/OmpD-associated family protein [Paenibacillus oenotherae]
MVEFTAVINMHEGMDAAYIEFPFDVEALYGVRGQVKVKATFDGYEYRGILAKMGLSCHCIGLTKAVRQSIGKQGGDSVHVTIERDAEPRMIEVPELLQAELMHHPSAGKTFEGLSHSNKRKYISWLTSAKREDTRRNRLERTIAMLEDGVKHP